MKVTVTYGRPFEELAEGAHSSIIIAGGLVISTDGRQNKVAVKSAISCIQRVYRRQT